MHCGAVKVPVCNFQALVETHLTYGYECMMHSPRLRPSPSHTDTQTLPGCPAHLPIWLPVSAGKSPELNNEAAGRLPVGREKRRKWLSVSGNNRKSLRLQLCCCCFFFFCPSLSAELDLRGSDRVSEMGRRKTTVHGNGGFLQPSPITVPGPFFPLEF